MSAIYENVYSFRPAMKKILDAALRSYSDNLNRQTYEHYLAVKRRAFVLKHIEETLIKRRNHANAS